MQLLVKFAIVTECQHSFFFFCCCFCTVQASKFWGLFLTLDNQSITFTAMMIGVSECMKTAWSDWKPAKLEIGNRITRPRLFDQPPISPAMHSEIPNMNRTIYSAHAQALLLRYRSEMTRYERRCPAHLHGAFENQQHILSDCGMAI